MSLQSQLAGRVSGSIISHDIGLVITSPPGKTVKGSLIHVFFVVFKNSRGISSIDLTNGFEKSLLGSFFSSSVVM